LKTESGRFLILRLRVQIVFFLSILAKKPNRIGVDKRRDDNTDESLRIKEQKKRSEEKLEDEQFLASFNINNSVELINSFKDKLEFDWDQIFLSRLPEVLELNPENLVIV
jgi:hypothetical protein